ncbi:hypothetical protein [Halomonas sp.]|uniref:hypothetical protein n=1 Tax=Halomonas sp. TaxID=1486246 RepID=UPI003567E18B
MAADDVAQAVNQIAESLGVSPSHVRINVEHPVFGSHEITHEGVAEKGAKPKKTEEQKASLAKAGTSEKSHEGSWFDLTDEERANLREMADDETVNKICEGTKEHRHAKGRCPAKKANGERCDYGRQGFNTTFCVKHEKAGKREIHPDALN